MMNKKIRNLIILLITIILIITLVILTTKPFTHGEMLRVSTTGEENVEKIEKIKENNDYYLIIHNAPIRINNKEEVENIRLHCDKSDFDKIKDGTIYYIRFEFNIFNKTKAKLINIQTNNSF
ncbi:hypothetical protein [Clostridium sp.]|uniref:hypothetical protein n=1 Tax=Clostridium sp. TaxID=1506 RepID=UPI002FDEA69A